jgi:hypothetical protein
MSIDLFGLLEPEKKEEPKKEEKPKSADIKAKPQKTSNNTKKAETSQNGQKTPSKKKDTKPKEVKYTYPFNFYTEGREIDITNYGFVDGQEYTANEITKTMLDHRHYEFAGDMTYNMIKDDNMLVATAKQFKKG